MILVALAVGAALQLETGAVRYASGGDDTYVEEQYPNNMRMTSAAFGAALKLHADHAELSIGWRSLGQESINAEIIIDAAYWACGGGGAPKGYKPSSSHCTSPAIAWWHSEGSVSQLFAEAGYSFHVGAVDLVPSIGIGQTDFSWHLFDFALPHTAKCAVYADPNQRRAEPFAGLTVRHGAIGAGIYLLQTKVNHAPEFQPGEGGYATYLRVTYSFSL